MNIVNSSADHGLTGCTGHFCGRVNNSIRCGACPWGSKPLDNGHGSTCEVCSTALTLHGWLYLGFLAILPIFPYIHKLPSNSFGFVVPTRKDFDKSPRDISVVPQNTKHRLMRFTYTLLRSSVTAVFPLIHILAATCSLLLFEPYGSLYVFGCMPQWLNEFYAPLLAASGCASEVVYPFTSLPLTYYALSALGCIIFYLIILLTNANSQKKRWVPVLHATLYAYPILCLCVIIFGGILYFTFAHVLLVAAILHSVYRFPILFDYHTGGMVPLCNPLLLLKALFIHPKPCCLSNICLNVFCYSYAFLAQNQSILWSLILSVVPILFYILTLPLTHPFIATDGETATQLASMCQLYDSPACQLPTVSSQPVDVDRKEGAQPSV